VAPSSFLANMSIVVDTITKLHVHQQQQREDVDTIQTDSVRLTSNSNSVPSQCVLLTTGLILRSVVAVTHVITGP